MKLSSIGLLLVLVGFTLVLLAIILSIASAMTGEYTTAFCIVVFFIPICFGKAPVWLLIALSIIVFIISLVFIFSTLFVTKRLLASNRVSNKKNLYSTRLTLD